MYSGPGDIPVGPIFIVHQVQIVNILRDTAGSVQAPCRDMGRR